MPIPFWQNILHKRNAITEVPKERWDVDLYFNADRRAKDRSTPWGGFLDDFTFDPLKFGMPPNTLTSIEPMQLIMLEMVHRALADAGYLERSFNKRETSVHRGHRRWRRRNGTRPTASGP